METTKLRVKPHVKLPHIVTKGKVDYVFTPDAEVPADYAAALLKTYPGIYEKASGTANLEKYTYKKEFKNKTMVELIGQLTEEEQVVVAKYVSELIEKRGAKEEKGTKGAPETKEKGAAEKK